MSSSWRYAILIGCIYPVAAALILLQNDYWKNVLISVMLFTLLAVSWNLLSGFTGYISFGHAAFFAVGGYTVGILARFPLWLVVPLAGFTAAVIGLVFAAPSLRIKGLYFALVTLGLAEILRVVIQSGSGITGGAGGIVFHRISQTDTSILLGVVTGLVVVYALRLPRTQFGKRLIAIRGDEVAAAALGIDVARHKIVIFAVSAFTTGLAGAFYALWLGYLEPADMFSTGRLITIIAMNLFGGMFTPIGPLIGAAALAGIQELTWSHFPFLHQVLFGIAILLFGLFMPKGVYGAWQERKARRAASAARSAVQVAREVPA